MARTNYTKLATSALLAGFLLAPLRVSAAGPGEALRGYLAARWKGDIEAALSTAAVELAERDPTLAEVRSALLARLRRLATIERGSATLPSAAIDQLLDALRHDEVLGIQGAGRERGRQPARAVAEARAQLKHAGVPTAIANGLLILYKIVPTRST